MEPEVGELVTSLDMAGCSLTLMWLDDELENLWRAPADTPAYRKGKTQLDATGSRRRGGESTADSVAEHGGVPLDEDTQRCAATVVAAVEIMRTTVTEMEAELGRIDAVAGDGDHGRGMVRGTAAAAAAARDAQGRGRGPGTILVEAGDAWASKAGGTSGVLWGAALAAAGNRIGDAAPPNGDDLAASLRAGYDALTRLGKAQPGDKTMLDALLPFLEAFEEGVQRGASVAKAWAAAAVKAQEAARATAQMRPKVGRARPLAERSVGTPDAGAVSLAACLTAIHGVLTRE